MPKAIFVCLAELYPVLNHRGAKTEALRTALRLMTCCFWRVSPVSASGVSYLFGVFGGKVVSAYRVNVASRDWPRIPSASQDERRRVIPATELPPEHWSRTKSWSNVRMNGPIRFGVVTLDAKGSLLDFALDKSANATTGEEQERQ